MKRSRRITGVCGLIVLGVWLAGCGGAQTPQDRFAREVQIEQERLAELQAVADSLTATRLRLLDEYRNLQEVSTMSPEEIGMEVSQAPPSPPSGDGGEGGVFGKIGGAFGKIGGGLKKLWPF